MVASEPLFVDEIIAFAIYLENRSMNSLLLHIVNVMYLCAYSNVYM